MYNKQMFLKIPDKIKIGGFIYTVYFTDNISHDHLAECDYRNTSIFIRSSINRQRQEQAFLHEIIHAVMSNSGYVHEQDEKIVDGIANGLYALIVDNPTLFEVAECD